MAEKATVKVFRYDPAVDAGPYYDTFEVPYDPYNSVLQVLTDIREKQDPSLALRESCWVRCCLICTLRVNGKSKVACRTRMSREMVIEPVNRSRVVRDLVELDKRDVDSSAKDADQAGEED